MGLIGTIVRKDGALCVKLENSSTFYPCTGMSGFAMKLREAIGAVQAGDVGKQVHNVAGVLQVENETQRADYRKAFPAISGAVTGRAPGRKPLMHNLPKTSRE